MHPSPRGFLSRSWKRLVWLSLLGALMGCVATSDPLPYDPIPESWKKATLNQFVPPAWMEDLRKWAPGDSDMALLVLLDGDSVLANCSGWNSAAIEHQTVMLHFGASRICAEEKNLDLALRHAHAAQKLDSENALVELWLARLLARSGQVTEARMIFFESHRFHSANLYGRDVEMAVLRVLKKAGRTNPLTLMEAMGRFSEWSFGHYEEDLEVLSEVFLEPLEAHPYDIRRRAPQAALRMVWVGQELRRQALAGPRILWLGMQESSLGYAMEAKGWEFLLALGHTFERPDLLGTAERGLRRVQWEAESMLPILENRIRQSASMEFLDSWQEWGSEPDCTVERALERSSKLKVWLQSRREWERIKPSSD